MVTGDNKFRDMAFSYDANGRMVKATRSETPDAWTVYDALGNRVAAEVNDVWTFMIYDAFGKLVAEYGQTDEGTGGISYIQQDWQGSVRTVTNSNGFVVGDVPFIVKTWSGLPIVKEIADYDSVLKFRVSVPKAEP